MSLLTRLPRSIHLRRGYATVVEAAGVKVLGIETGLQPSTSTISVVVKAGSRFQTQPGLAHVLKNFAFKSTSSGSALKTVRETELYGGALSAALSREHLFLTAEFLRGDEAYFLSLLSSVLSSTHFLPHEYAELVLPTIQAESVSAIANPQILALDVAHQLAFRRGLGNSLFASPHSPVSAEQVKQFAQTAFAKSNIAVVGTGISTDALSKAVSSAFGSSAGGPSSSLSSSATTYYGGEQRIPLDGHAGPSAQPTLLIAYGSKQTGSADLSVLASLLGGSSNVKWTAGSSPLGQAAAAVPGAEAKAFVLPYSDASLFGVTITAPTSEGVKTVSTKVAELLKNFKPSAEEVKRAAAKAKFTEAVKSERTESLIAAAGAQIFSGKVASAESTLSALEKVSTDSLSKLTGELFKGKPTVVAIGDLHVLPYADELKL